MKEKKNEGEETLYLLLEMKHSCTLIFFISFKLELVELSRVVLGTFSNFLVLFYRSILSFLKHQSGDKNLIFGVKTEGIAFFPSCVFSSPLLPTTCCSVSSFLSLSDTIITTFFLLTALIPSLTFEAPVWLFGHSFIYSVSQLFIRDVSIYGKWNICI